MADFPIFSSCHLHTFRDLDADLSDDSDILEENLDSFGKIDDQSSTEALAHEFFKKSSSKSVVSHKETAPTIAE